MATFMEILRRHSNFDASMFNCESGSISFKEAYFSARSISSGLLKLGVSSGDRVAIWMPNTPAWLEIFMACTQLGAIVVAINTRFSANELGDVIERSGASIIVAWLGHPKINFSTILKESRVSSLPQIKAIVTYEGSHDQKRGISFDCPVISYKEMLCEPQYENEHSSGDMPCIIFTTSGTTKKPKLVLHNQNALINHGKNVVSALKITSTSTVILIPPLCGVFGFCTAVAAFVAARPLVMITGWDPPNVVSLIDRFAVTHLIASDDAIDALLEQSDRTPVFPTVKFCGYGALNPSRSNLIHKARNRYLDLIGLYGASEVQGLFARQDDSTDLSCRYLAGGKPVSSDVQIRIRDISSGKILDTDEPGEIEIYAPSTRMVEYYKDEEATRLSLTDDGWYKSGDVGYTKRDGSFIYLRRSADFLRLGGFLVSPSEIELVIQECRNIELCQVIQIDYYGMARAFAFIKSVDNVAIDEVEIMNFAKTKLAHYKIPVRIFQINEFPYIESSNGNKISKERLKKMVIY